MKMTIKEILEKAEKKDKVTFKGIIKAVYDGAESKTKYTNFKQNLIIKDETAEVRVVYNYKEKEEEYPKDIVGKEIEIINGVFSEYVNQKGETQRNIFGRLTFKEGEEPIVKRAEPNVAGSKKSSMPLIIEVRGMALKRSMEFWAARIGDKMEENKIIATAEVFYKYISGNPAKATIQNVTPQPQTEGKEEKKELTTGRSKEQIIKLDNIPLINECMVLKEEHHYTPDQWEAYTRGKDIKTMTIGELEDLRDTLKDYTSDIPF